MSQEITEVRGEPFARSEAMVKIHTDRRHVRTVEGNDPANALDRVLRHVVTRNYPVCADFELANFKVHILDEEHAETDTTVRVLTEVSDGHRSWRAVSIGADVIGASWEALFEAY